MALMPGEEGWYFWHWFASTNVTDFLFRQSSKPSHSGGGGQAEPCSTRQPFHPVAQLFKPVFVYSTLILLHHNRLDRRINYQSFRLCFWQAGVLKLSMAEHLKRKFTTTCRDLGQSVGVYGVTATAGPEFLHKTGGLWQKYSIITPNLYSNIWERLTVSNTIISYSNPNEHRQNISLLIPQ